MIYDIDLSARVVRSAYDHSIRNKISESLCNQEIYYFSCMKPSLLKCLCIRARLWNGTIRLLIVITYMYPTGDNDESPVEIETI